MKLIQTQNHLLLIDEECKIKEGDLCLVTINGEENYHIWIYLSHNTIRDYSYSDLQGNFKKWGIKEKSKIIAYYPLNSEAKELDLPLLPNPFKEEVNIEKLAISSFGYKPTKVDNSIILSLSKGYIRGFQDGYKAATKQFSLEDMKKAIEMARIGFKNYPSDSFKSINNYIKSETSKIIQSLSTQQLPKEFITEYEIVPDQNNYGSGEIFSTNMKEVLKTITNSEGKEELVGTYKY